MKDIIINIILPILIAVLLISWFSVFIWGCANWGEFTQTRNERMQVIEANNGNYAVVDSEGEVWEFTSDRIYFVGEVLKVKLNTLGTESIFDDEIIAVKN